MVLFGILTNLIENLVLLIAYFQWLLSWVRSLFKCGHSELWVWYRYDQWCVGNLRPLPFQTWHDWICMSSPPRGRDQFPNHFFCEFWEFKILKFLKWESSWFLKFFISTGLFGCGCSVLGVWYWYGWWCVENLGPYPFQTWHDGICSRLLQCQRLRFCSAAPGEIPNFSIFFAVCVYVSLRWFTFITKPDKNSYVFSSCWDWPKYHFGKQIKSRSFFNPPKKTLKKNGLLFLCLR